MYRNIPEVMTFKECQLLLKIGKNTLLELLHTRQIDGFRIGNRWRIPKESVVEFMERRWKGSIIKGWAYLKNLIKWSYHTNIHQRNRYAQIHIIILYRKNTRIAKCRNQTDGRTRRKKETVKFTLEIRISSKSPINIEIILT